MNKDRLDREILDSIIEMLQKFGETQLPREKRLQLDREDIFPEELIRQMLSPEIGLQLLFIPEEFGGLGGGAYDIYRVSEEMAKIELGVATAFLAISLGTDPIRVGGTESQKEHWMSKIGEEGLIVAYGATEPEAGSDLGSFSTTAVPIKDEAGNTIRYKLTGVKQFITNGGVADLYSILAKTPGGPAFFLVERDAAGLSIGKSEEKHGVRLSNTAQVILEEVEVPADQLIGLEEGHGIAQAVAVFGYTRLMVAAFGLGGGLAALDRAISYSRERRQFNKELIEHQGFAYKLLIPNAVKLEAGRAYIEAISDRLDSGETDLEAEGAIAKYFTTEAGNAAAEAAIQALGGYGYVHEYEVEKIKRDVRITTIYEGTSEILQQTIAKDRWRKFLRSGGNNFTDIISDLEKFRQPALSKYIDVLSEALQLLRKTFDIIRSDRLTRQQHVLFKMADMVTGVETAAALLRKASNSDEAISMFTNKGLQAAARIYVTDAAMQVQHISFECIASFGSGGRNGALNFYQNLSQSIVVDCLSERQQDILILYQELKNLEIHLF